MNTLFLQQKLDSIEALLCDDSLTAEQALNDIRGVINLPAPPSNNSPILAKVKVGDEIQFHVLVYNDKSNTYSWNTYDDKSKDIDPHMVVIGWDWVEALVP